MATALDQAPEFMAWTWADIEPQYAALAEREINADTVDQFLRDWSALSDRVSELGTRLHLATDMNTADEEASARYQDFVQEIDPKVEEAEHGLTLKLLESGIEPDGLEVPLKRMRVDVALFREENLPLETEEQLLVEQYFKITGSQTVEWEGKEIPISQLSPVLQEQDRDKRERAWMLGATRRFQDRERLDEIWQKLLDLRLRMARNAGFSDYRTYRWQQLKRFDYTPDDAKEFARSVERVVVPVVTQLAEERTRQLGIQSLRPWDRDVDVFGRDPLHPYSGAEELESGVSSIFHRVDPAIGRRFDTMQQEGLLDLRSRKNKTPGAYCIQLSALARPFIFGNATGVHDDVVTLLHEGGHAVHVFEMSHLPYDFEKGFGSIPMEFAEVGSMAMELLAAPYLSRDAGGFYSPEDATRARLDHLESILTILPWTAVVDGFQHWVYEHPEDAADPAKADAAWEGLMDRFMSFVDWSGLEELKRSDWRRILHMFMAPFYFLEYALAQLGAIQVWANAQRDQAEAVRKYRAALALGGTRTLPQLFEAAGARFAFDEETIREAVTLVKGTIDELKREQHVDASAKGVMAE
jgi:oligoendopeptidase F